MAAAVESLRGWRREETFVAFFVALLEDRRATDGWVRVEKLADQVGISRATAYRYVEAIESFGRIVITHDDGHNNNHRGVRPEMVLTRRTGHPILGAPR
jgi:predicted DNA-binding transcriptional regulator YafY